MLDINTISKLGIGAWGIGGFAQRNPDNDDEKQIQALIYALNNGINFLEVNFWNSEGSSVDLIQKALFMSNKKREDVFLSQAIYNYTNPTIEDAKKEFEMVLKVFNTSYIDTLEFPLSAIHKYGLDPIITLLTQYLHEGKIRYISITNSNLEYLKKFKEIFKDKLFSHEVHFSFEVRENERLGILQYAKQHDIKSIIYQPLRRNKTAQHNWPLLVELSKKYHHTQNQIILSWIVTKGYLPLVKSEDIEHIKENLDALNLQLSPEDQERLNLTHIPYTVPKIDWFVENNGTPIFMLPNVFDDLYSHQSPPGK